jgi:hypothetical protein
LRRRRIFNTSKKNWNNIDLISIVT